MSVQTVRVPETGSSEPGEVIEIPVQAGDTIAAEDTIVVLESDKATMEVPAPVGGKIVKMLVSVGDRIGDGDPVLELETQAEDGDGEAAGGDSGTDQGHQAAAADSGGGEASGEGGEASGEKVPEQAQGESDLQAAGSTERKRMPVEVPDLGDIEQAELIELPVNKGDTVEAEQVIATLESDKASLEIPAPAAGVVTALQASVGDKVRTGDVLLELEVAAGGDAAAQEPAEGRETPEQPDTGGDRGAQSGEQKSAPSEQQARTRGPEQPPARGVQGEPSRSVHAGPAVRRLARELGVDLAEVTGSGPKGRILKEDVHAHVNRLLSTRETGASGGGLDLELPDIDFSRFGEIERVELNRLRKLSASNLHRSWLTIPHVTQHDVADITTLEEFRREENKRLEKEGVKLTMLAFLVKASAVALHRFPDFNSSLEKGGEALIHKKYVHIGVAVDTPNGLMVPVVRDADHKGIVEIAREVAELARKARERKLSPGDMQGGTFSISSLGGIGGTAFTPVVNWPEVAILGASRSHMAPRWNGSDFEPRLMLPLSLSYDHRVIDGAAAARFTRFLAETLEDMRRALL